MEDTPPKKNQLTCVTYRLCVPPPADAPIPWEELPDVVHVVYEHTVLSNSASFVVWLAVSCLFVPCYYSDSLVCSRLSAWSASPSMSARGRATP